MLKRSFLATVILLGIMFTVGYAEAAEREISTRTPATRSISTSVNQVQSTGSLSLSKILRLRFLHTWKMLAELDDAQPEPPVFSTNGLSDGPDPIDGGGQVGGGGANPPDEEQQGETEGSEEGAAGSQGSVFDTK